MSAMKASLSEWDDWDTRYQARPASAEVVGKDIFFFESKL